MKKKILFVINTMGRAGAEKCLLSMLRYMDKQAYEISLFSVINRGELFLEVPEGVRLLNEHPCAESVMDKKAKRYLMKEILKGGLQNGYFIRNVRYLWKTIVYQRSHCGLDFKKLFFKLLADHAPRQEETYDLAVGYIQGAATYYVMEHVNAAKKVLFLHNEFLDSGYCPELEKRYYQRADAIFCVSQSIRNHFAEVYPQLADKMDVFYNLVNQEEIWEKARQEIPGDPVLKEMKAQKQKGTLLLCTAARLEKVKAFDIAIPALAMVRNRGISVNWYVLGEGSEREELERLILEQHVSDCFFLLGAKENPYPYMSACDVYVQATRYEGFCTSISEAVILGKPVIASKCGGNIEQLLYYDTGMLVELTPEDLANAIIRIATDGEFQMQLTAKSRVQNQRVEESLQRLYAFTDTNKNGEL